MENIAQKLLRPVIRRAAANLPEPDGSSLRESMKDKAFAKAFEAKAENVTVALLRARRDQTDADFEAEVKELLDFTVSRPEWTLLDGFMGGSHRSSITSMLVEKGLPPARVATIQRLLKQKLRINGPEAIRKPMASAVEQAAAQAAANSASQPTSLWARLSSRSKKNEH